MNIQGVGRKLIIGAAVVVAGICCVGIWWKSYRFEGCDMVLETYDIPGKSSLMVAEWKQFVPDFLLYWIGTSGNEEYEVRMYLPDDQRVSLARVLNDYDFRRESERGADIPSNGILGKFLLAIDGQPHVLVMYYGEAAKGGRGEDANVFSLYRVDVTRCGEVVPLDQNGGDMKGFRSKKLYRDLEGFLQSLPSGSKARSTYDFVRQWWGETSGTPSAGDTPEQ